MPPKTRSQDARRVDETTNLEQPQAYDHIQQQLNDTRADANTRFREFKEAMDALVSRVDTALQKTQLSSGECSLPKASQLFPPTRDSLAGFNWINEGTPPQYQLHRPKREFPIFEGEDVLKWIYKCNQYFDMEETVEQDKLKLASYYLDGMALCWHQNYIRSLRGQVVSWSEYVEALCCRFGEEKNPLEELIELKQKNDLETYIKDFDILWNRSEISKKNALVFFIGGLDVEVKNMIKMFEPKSLKQAYTLARLQDNTFTHRRYGSNPNKQTYHPTTFAYPNKHATLSSYNKNFPTGFPSTSLKPPQAGLLPNPPPCNPNITQRTTRPIRNRDLDERRAKGICFWCDEKFIPGHRCQNKKLYSLCVMEENGEGSEDEGAIDLDPDTYHPHISLNALEGVTGLNTLRVTGKVEKQPLVILVDSGSTHNFINNHVADRLHCNLTNIKALTVQVADDGIMACTFVCNNFQ